MPPKIQHLPPSDSSFPPLKIQAAYKLHPPPPPGKNCRSLLEKDEDEHGNGWVGEGLALSGNGTV